MRPILQLCHLTLNYPAGRTRSDPTLPAFHAGERVHLLRLMRSMLCWLIHTLTLAPQWALPNRYSLGFSFPAAKLYPSRKQQPRRTCWFFRLSAKSHGFSTSYVRKAGLGVIISINRESHHCELGSHHYYAGESSLREVSNSTTLRQLYTAGITTSLLALFYFDLQISYLEIYEFSNPLYFSRTHLLPV